MMVGCNYAGNKKLSGITNVAIDRSLRLHLENYPITKQNIATYASKNCRLNEMPGLQKAFISIVCDSIIPYWMGTKWNFNGFTEKPQQDTIACGYFVTTVLRDAGVKLNRIALAQCASEEMIQKLVNKKYIHRYSNISQSVFINRLQETGKGLYIVGLDNHTGFIHYADDGIWFIHSSYVSPGVVAKQDAINNSILSFSKYRVTGKISDDELLLKSWYRNLALNK
jgi:hypothetical protein